MRDIFSNREIATAIWSSFLVAYAFSSEKVRLSFGRVLKTLFTRPILITFLLIISYVGCEVLLLKRFKVWNFSLLKETIFWFVFSAVGLFIKMVSRAEDKEVSITGLIKSIFGVMLFLEFLLSNYTFSIPVELVLTPVAAFLGLSLQFANMNPEHAFAAKIINRLLAALGLMLIAHAVRMAVVDPSLFTTNSARQLLISPLLTVLFIPLLYIMSLYSVYEMMNFRITFGLRNSPHWINPTKRKSLQIGKFNLNRTRRLSKVIARQIWRAKSLQEINCIFEEFSKPVTIRENQWVELKTTGEKVQVVSVKEDFAILSFKDGSEEIWVGDLKCLGMTNEKTWKK